MFTMDDLLDIAIKMEQNGENVYTRSGERIKNQEIRSMLLWMAKEEANHGKWFADRKETLSLDINEINLKKMVPKVLHDMMGEKTLSLDEVDFDQFSKVSDLMEAFITFEYDTILFYEMLEMFIEDDKVLKGLKQIIEEEKKHVKKLADMASTFSSETF